MSTRSKGSLVWKVLISVALVVVILMIVAEFGLRWYISDSMKKQLVADSGSQASAQSVADASISFGPTPLLLSALTKNIPSVDIDTPSTLNISEGNPPSVVGTPAAQLQISDLDTADPNNPIAGHLVVHTQLPEKYLLAQIQLAMAQQQASQGNDIASQLMANFVRVTDVQANGEKGTIDVTFTDGAANLSIRPTSRDGSVTFEAENAQLFGFNLPQQATAAITDALDKQAANAGGNLSVDEIRVQNDILDIAFSGNDVPLSEAQQQR
ncbi:LmeA family phospholipid-binding protein [Corynebacterium epidermidicanis]|uniref:Putative DUF2993 family protein n=1 Tax=Corynebacterium epidermidicanis TaxID=1050174 RepID=A0A0G3GYY5_9CORY|nr:DUF2993 domain-containing protein [Corynebacterium epidermidicanis]AKK04067.1 putative DUF2993 family protein [Corynebacterium epidermidicanis]